MSYEENHDYHITIAALRARVEAAEREARSAFSFRDAAIRAQNTAEARADELEKDANIIRRIREIRGGMKKGVPCGCEFDDNDNCLTRCALHKEVYDRVTELERELAELKRAHESTADIMDVFRSANIDNAADARQFIKELAALQGKRNTAYSYIEDVLIGSPYEWAGKRLLEMIGDK